MSRPERQQGEQVEDGACRKEHQAAADGHAEAEAHREQHQRHLDQAEDQVGHELSQHQAERVDGGDQQLLERALLALAHDGPRRQHHADASAAAPPPARDDVVGGPPFGVEEDDRLRARSRRPATVASASRVEVVLRDQAVDGASACALTVESEPSISTRTCAAVAAHAVVELGRDDDRRPAPGRRDLLAGVARGCS